MKKLLLFLISTNILFASSPIWGEERIKNVELWGNEGTLKLGKLFTLLQSEYFAMFFLVILVAVPSVFALHYMILGPKVFSHDGKKFYIFNLFTRIIHWIAAVAWLMLIPTGFILMFGDFFGGGVFVKFAKNLHGIGTIIFSIVVLPMFFTWVKSMFLHVADFKWLMIAGGYLSKRKNPVPANKFNAGQKTWYWASTLGGFIMIITGALMFFLEYDILWLRELTGWPQISLLRAAAIVHNTLAMIVVIMFLVHIYMAVFAIKGAINSMITGYKTEDELKILHSLWYEKIKNKF